MSHVFCYFPFSRASCAPLSVCLSVRLSVSLNVCLRHEFGAPLILMATWLLLSLHTCSKPHTCNPSTHPLFSISTLVLQPLTARQLLQSVRFIVTQALQFVVSSYSSCVYSPFTCFFCLFVCFFPCSTACLPGCTLPSLQFSHPVSQFLVSQNSPLLIHAFPHLGLSFADC